MNYLGKSIISKKALKYYNDLLSLDLEENYPYYNKEEIERLGAKQDDYIGITTVHFKNGNFLTIDLASGNSNYYDNIVLYNKEGKELYVLGCDYNIGNFEFEYANDKYIIILEKEGKKHILSEN